MKFIHVKRHGGYDCAIISIAMKINLLIVMMVSFLLQVQAFSYGQTISIRENGVSIKEVFNEIRRQSGYTVVYQSEHIRSFESIDVDIQHATIEEALDQLLVGKPLTYTIKDKAIVIQAKRSVRARITATDLPLEVPQNREITGRVTNEAGQPMVGVSVAIAGRTGGTVTDDNGGYRITVPGGDVRLTYRYIGYLAEEVTVGNRQSIDVVLREDVSQLSEVVVTALGIERENRSLGYATQVVDGENLTMAKEQNVLGALAGKVAGVQVVGASGASMGGTQKIKIRGVNSISGSGQPLIVVDGTPISNANYAGSSGVDYGNLSQDINPEDVASINVLKGPAASALYGIRGQYGVVLITTNKGKQGVKKVDVQLNSAFSLERAGNFFPLQNLYGQGSSTTWRTLPNGDKYIDFTSDESWGPKMDGTLVRQAFSFYPQDPEYGQLTPFQAYPDNIKSYYQNGHNINNGISVAGGNENTSFRISFNDTRIGGVEPNSWLNRNNVGVAAGLDLSDKLNVSTNLNYATNKAQRPPQGYGSKSMVQWLPRSVDIARLADYKYPDGTFVNWNINRPSAATGELTNFQPLYWVNPFVETHENVDMDQRDRFFGDMGLTYQVIPELKLSGFARMDTYTQNIENISLFRYSSTIPQYAIDKYQNKEMNFEFLGQYSKTFGDLSLNANVGANLYTRRYTYLTQATQGGLSAPGFYNIDASIDRPSVSSYLLRKEIKSIYGMASLGYKDAYFLDVSIRNDNSSALPVNNNSYWYPSISGSWVFSEQLQRSWLSLGKLRVSYAQAGSDLNPYETSAVYGIGSVYAGPRTVNTLVVPDNLNNPNIKPSFAHAYEAGADLRFFKDRLGIDFTYYVQRNENQIIQLDVSGSSGFSSVTINAGLIQNKGVELALMATPVKYGNVQWDATLNLSRNRSKVVELYPGVNVYGNGSTTFSSVTTYLNSYVGKPFGSLIGQAYQRDPATGMILLDNNNLPMYTDATHDFGSVVPDMTGGFQNTLRIGKFDVGAMMDFQVGGKFFSRTKMILVRVGVDPITTAINDRGMNVRDPVEDGGGVKVHGISASTGEEVTTYVNARDYYNQVIGRRVYEEWLYDASYVKLREVRVGYSFGKLNFGDFSLSDVNIGLIARNPAMIWQRAPKGLDPSEMSSGSSSISWFESGQTNTVRSYGLNLKVLF